MTRNNVARQRAFSERITELMKKYANQQLTSAEVVAELVELAKEVAAEGNRGARFTPPLNSDELAFYDAVAANEAAVEVLGEGVLADIARQLVAVMRRDVRTEWTVRDEVRAKLRSSIKRLLARFVYPRRSSRRPSSWSWNRWSRWGRGLLRPLGPAVPEGGYLWITLFRRHEACVLGLPSLTIEYRSPPSVVMIIINGTSGEPA